MPFRKIIHVDMDAFYASVEQRDYPEYRGKPLIVGGVSKRGVVSAASYEARKYGIHSAMPAFQAKKICPHVIAVHPRFDVYKQVSVQVRNVFLSYTDLVEPLSLDEAFLDISENKINLPSATLIAKKIRADILRETGLTASAGVSYNKFLAKIASDYNKPDGMFVIEPDQAQEFLDKLPVKKFFGIGKVTAEKMHEVGIFFGRDLRGRSKERLRQYFGKAGVLYYDLVRGTDNRPVNPERIQKSVGAENTFSENLHDTADMKKKLDDIAETLIGRINKKQKFGKTLTLKVKFIDFRQITRSKTNDYLFLTKEDLLKTAFELLEGIDFKAQAVRLLGLSVANFEEKQKSELPIQLSLEFDFE